MAVQQPVQFADNLRFLRDMYGYTQCQISSVLHMRRANYARYETGQNPISLDLARDLTDLYQIGIDTVLLRSRTQLCRTIHLADRQEPPLPALLVVACRLSPQDRHALLRRAASLLQQEQTVPTLRAAL